MLSFGGGNCFGVLLGEFLVTLVCCVFRDVAYSEGIATGTVAEFAKRCEIARPPTFGVWAFLREWYCGSDCVLQGSAEGCDGLVELFLGCDA